MSIFEALILGLIQGLTEFLPVSSSGHIELGAHFLGVDSADNLLFSIIVHGATALSTIVIFRKYIGHLILEFLKFEWNESTQFMVKIAISMIPVAVVGLFFEDKITALFTGQIIFVASMLIVTGLLLLLTNYRPAKDKNISFAHSLIIGLSQAGAILPGISRSGATIATALLLGIDKNQAARFSFLMVLPPILGATLLKTIDFIGAEQSVDSISLSALTAGFIAAFIAGLLACQWMINIVKRGKLIYFAIYCFTVGFVVIALTLI